MVHGRIIAAILVLLFPLSIYAKLTSPWFLDGYAMGEAVDNMHGGIKTGTIATAAGRLTATYDTEIANWWHGGQFALGVLGIAQNHSQSQYTGAIQTPSSFSAFSEIRINDLAYQHSFNDSFMLRAGIMDMDDWFNINQVGLALCNAAFDNTLSLSGNAQIPTYPYPGFGAFANIGFKKISLLLGVFQGNPNHQDTVFERGQLVIAEMGTKFSSALYKTLLNYSAKVGVWGYQQNLTYVGLSDHGIYIIGEATWKTKASRKLGASIEFGFNPKKLHSITDSVAVSFSIGNLWQKRPNDSLNFGWGRAWEKGLPHFETFYECNYTIALTETINLVPDIQYFTHPGCRYANAWVGILRLIYTIPVKSNILPFNFRSAPDEI